jgi:hypothetical protein
MLSNALARKRCPIRIVSTHTQRQGMLCCAIYMIHTLRVMSNSPCRIEVVQWVTESKRPFVIVKDHRFKSLIKMGRPEYWLPLPATVAWDVKHVFVNMRSQLAAKLKVTFCMTRTNLVMLKTKHRHTMVAWTLQLMHGPPLMAEHSLLWWHTLRRVVTSSWNEASSYASWTRVSSRTGQKVFVW